nr:NAD(P)-dependent oxidoreductase [Auraticoccus cholistanensis]
MGNLGLAVATRLARTGEAPLVHDVDADAVARAEQAGCQPADPEQLAEAGTLWLLVPDDDAVREVLTGDEGLLDRLSPGTLVVLCSTVSPGTAAELAGSCREAGVQLVEAPVSGGADAALEGELLVLLGGDDEALDRAEEACAPVASRTVRTGPAGTASVVKLCNQHVLFAGLTALHEAVALAGRAGVDEAVLVDALAGGTARSWAVETWGFYDRLERDYAARGVPQRGRPWDKDLRHVLEVAHQHEVDLPTAQVALDTLGGWISRHAGGAEADPSPTGGDSR